MEYCSAGVLGFKHSNTPIPVLLVSVQLLHETFLLDFIDEAHIDKLRRISLSRADRRQDVFDFLRQRSNAEKFQIIFADPPYEKTHRDESHTEKLLNNESLPQLLEPNGIFVLEKRPTETLPQTKLWRVLRQKTYGATEVFFLEPMRN